MVYFGKGSTNHKRLPANASRKIAVGTQGLSARPLKSVGSLTQGCNLSIRNTYFFLSSNTVNLTFWMPNQFLEDKREHTPQGWHANTPVSTTTTKAAQKKKKNIQERTKIWIIQLTKNRQNETFFKMWHCAHSTYSFSDPKTKLLGDTSKIWNQSLETL